MSVRTLTTAVRYCGADFILTRSQRLSKLSLGVIFAIGAVVNHSRTPCLQADERRSDPDPPKTKKPKPPASRDGAAVAIKQVDHSAKKIEPTKVAEAKKPRAKTRFGLPQFQEAIAERMLGGYLDAEAMKMFTALASGADMGPNQGWFGPSQSLYTHRRLLDRLDRNKNSRVEAEEFDGRPVYYFVLDRNLNGSIEPIDLAWNQSSMPPEFGMARMVFSRMDRDSNGSINPEEWRAAFRFLGEGRESLTPFDLVNMFRAPRRNFQIGASLKKTDGPTRPEESPAKKPTTRQAAQVSKSANSTKSARRNGRGNQSTDEPDSYTLLKGFFQGELGSMHEGPRLGSKAPDFELPTTNGKNRIRMSVHRGGRPVVLIFGSFT